jgi:tetratricopeptide (TPR) repeat protein
LGGLGLAAISGAVGAEGAVATAGALSWLAGVAGNQFQAWFGSKIKEPPPGAKEVFENYHLRALLGRAIIAAVEKKADWVKEVRGNASDLFRDAGEILAGRVDGLVDEPSGSFAELRDFNITSTLNEFVATQGNVHVLTLTLWLDLIAETPELRDLSDLERADLAGGLHEGFGKALWGLFKLDAATDRQAFASIELLYLSRILQAIQAIPDGPLADTSDLVDRIGVLLKAVGEQQRPYFMRVLGGVAAVQETQSTHTELLGRILDAVAAPKVTALDLLHTIPPPPRGFTGREKELDDLRNSAAQGGSVITGLKGMGGIGKTALALVLAREWASRFPDAALLLDGKGLAGDATPSAAKLMEQVLLAFHPQAKLPDDPAALPGIYRSVLQGKKALILLDNAKDAAQARPLVPPDGCGLIVTSRAGFAIDDRVLYAVGRLKDEDAEKLLRNSYPDLAHAELNELVRLCAGLPLALRLAATRFALEAAERGGAADVTGYLTKLSGGRLATLDADAPDAGEITISETLRLSMEPLSEEQKRAWEFLAIFRASFRADAAEAIAGASQEMLDSFLRRSLIEAEGKDRYKLHDLAADYARAKLSDVDLNALVLSHAAHYTAVACEANGRYLNGDPVGGLLLFDRERGQIECAWQALEKRPGKAVDGQLISLVNSIAYASSFRFDPSQQIAWLESQIQAARRLKLLDAEAAARGNLGIVYKNLGEAENAIDCLEGCLKIYEQLGDAQGAGQTLSNLGNVYLFLRRPSDALDFFRRGLALSRESKNYRGEANALGNIGNAYIAINDPAAAIPWLENQLKCAQELGDPRGIQASLGNLGIVHSNLGNPQKSLSLYKEALSLGRSIGDRSGEGTALWNISLLLKEMGQRREAIARAEEALAIYQAIEHPAALRVGATLAEWCSETY